MVACSLEHAGEELLGLRQRPRGLSRARLDVRASRCCTRGRTGSHGPLPASAAPAPDANGVPIHGVLPRVLPFAVTDQTASSVRRRVRHPRPPRGARGVPATRTACVVAGRRDRRGARDPNHAPRAQGRRPLPVAFGYHPYLSPPRRAARPMELDIPVPHPPRARRPPDPHRRARAGADRARRRSAGAASTMPSPTSAPTAASPSRAAGARSLSTLLEGYDFAQVYAPADRDLVCFEPMTAPDQRARQRRLASRCCARATAYTAAFRISVAVPEPGSQALPSAIDPRSRTANWIASENVG